MISAENTTLMRDASGLIAERMGLHFPEERWPDLARGLTAAGKEMGYESLDAWVRCLRARTLTTAQIETLAGNLTVGETYFLRDAASFAALEETILPSLVAKRRETSRTLRLWSAGCSTGEEAYSLAITCARVLPDLRAWNVSVLATDINPRFLAKAQAGVYSQWSFRGTPRWLRQRYFSLAQDKKFAVDPVVKHRVHLEHLNLVADVYPSLHNHTNAMDVIFCRNVLMYLTPEHQRQVVAGLYRCLTDGGYLVVGAAEVGASLLSMFVMETVGGAILCHKTAQPTSAPEPASAPAFPPRAPAPLAPAIVPSIATPQENLLALARTHADQGRLVEALTSCRDAIAAGRTDPAAYYLYAMVCHELGRLDDETVALRKVLYLDQDFVLAHCALGDLYQRLGMQKESRRHVAVALELLSARGSDDIVPESDGMTCGRLAESVRAMSAA